ncbi:MAG: trypsin-like peptidase domain-containing protein [Planctomycetaceae bacterium]|nr:trypsin-like peptidase domain-containing protein [Planctomycetaceae bacterium]
MADELTIPPDSPRQSPANEPQPELFEEPRPPLHIGQSLRLAASGDSEAGRPSIHPLDRRSEDPRGGHDVEDQATRIRLAWAKLLWLLAFLAVLLGISYLVPLIAENTQYALTRGRQRAEHDFALEHLPGSPLVELSRASQMVSQAVAPSVVHINTQGNEPDIPTFPMRSMRNQIPTQGQGSGIIVDTDGYILTNLHVINQASDIWVTLADGRKVKGQIVSRDNETDLALLKIDAEKLTAIRWGDSDQAEPGAMVWAMGSPFGLERSITSGILSAKNRAGLAGTAYQNFLQTDTAVNPGNSGGPLVNTEGQVIGVNTAIVGEAYQGISFAIPSNVAKAVFERLRDEGKVRRGWLGVELDRITDPHARDIGLPDAKGAYIVRVLTQEDGGSPAAKAGIQAGDVVLKWNNQPVTDPAQLSNAVAETEIGSKATVVVFRQGQEMQFDITVGLRPPMQ